MTHSSGSARLDSTRHAAAGQLALVQSRLDRLNAATSLFQALGGGWEPRKAKVASLDHRSNDAAQIVE
jgi:outer membrane protein TolC